MGKILTNEPLWNKTTFRIGGPADKLVYPETKKELERWLRSGEVTCVMGGGSNMLVSDAGVRGAVIHLGYGFRDVSIEKPGDGSVVVLAGAGISLTALSGLLMKESVSGLEFAYGIPGLLGGALVMNAGAMGGDMKHVVDAVKIMTFEGEEKTLTGDECGFSYRSSSFPEGAVVCCVKMILEEGDKKTINKIMRANQADRKARQPLEYPSAGSVYKNPEGRAAGRLIERAGLKGFAVGDAEVSGKHANFIINRGRATARDTLGLMKIIEDTVEEKFDVTLEREIRLVGEFDG